MPSSTENIKLGVCSVLYNAVDLGYTKGGVSVAIATSTHEVKVDQHGETALDEIITGRSITAKVPLAETTLTTLVSIMPGATLVTDGVTPTKKKVEVANGVGTSLRDAAQTLVLRPKGTTGADDVTIHLAATKGELEYRFMIDQERVWEVEFKGYSDDAGKLFTVGDLTATA